MTKYATAIIVILLLIAGAATALWYVVRGSSQTNAGAVTLSIEAPQDVGSGEDAVFTVSYRNGTRVPLNGAELFFKYPEGSVPTESPEKLVASETIGTLAPGAAGTREFRARVIGPKNSTIQARAELSYETAGVARFQKSAEAVVRIADTAFFLNVVVPQRAVSGERIVYFIDYTNVSARAFPDSVIEVRYPEGFAFAGSEPAPTDGAERWELGEVASGGKGRITVSGILSGTEGDTKRIRADVGFLRENKFFAYATNSYDTVIAPPPLSVSLSSSDNATVARRGQSLGFRVTYRNNAEVPISNVVLRAELMGDMFQPKTVSPDKGFFDSARNTILWTPANVKDLALLNPGDEHYVTFRLVLKDAFPIAAADDTNFSLRIQASIESINVPPYLALNKIVSTESLEIKISTDTEFSAWGRYRDDAYGVVNTGPLPPRVGQETQFTLHWRIAVPANDLENVEVRATLPTGVTPTGFARSYFTDAVPVLNATSGDVVWFIPHIPANTGVLMPAYEAIFQVTMTPSITQAGQSVELMRPSTVSAMDAYTTTALTTNDAAIRTDGVSEDTQRGKGEGTVQP